MSSPHSNTQSFPGLEASQQQPTDPQQPGPAETTQSPVSCPQIDNDPVLDSLLVGLYRSSAGAQFRSQAQWERYKLEYQRRCIKGGRRQTQPWDNSFDLPGNAFNNVRNRWIEQGIWRKVWDEAWAKKRDVGLSDESPRSPKPKPTQSKPGCRWGHENGGPPADQELGPDLHRTFCVKPGELGGMSLDEWLQRRPKCYVQDSLDGPNFPHPYPTPRNSEGSRPYRQFLYQFVKEREWIKDHMDHLNKSHPCDPYNVDLDSMAYETVKSNWIRDGIWKPEWTELPGSTWAHEDLLQEQDKAQRVGTVVDDSGEQPSPVVHGPSSRDQKGTANSPQASSQEASDPAGTDKESLAPKGVTTRGKQLAKGETAGAASNSRRLRPRASKAVADQRDDVSNSAQTKGAKRRRPGRGDQPDTSRSAKRQKKSGENGRGKK